MTDTILRLANITDAGEFERIATAILRYAEPELYRYISHQGVNIDGKTVKAPLDNVGWQLYQGENTLVCVAHTVTEKHQLKSKWLRDLDNVKPRKTGNNPTGNDGDLVKAIKEINKIREIYPNLKAYITLAYNCEEDQAVRIEAQNLAKANNVELRMWSVSNLANFLDIDANGQMIRYNHFKTLPNRLSKELLLHISQQSIQSYLKYIDTPIIQRDDRFKQGHLLVVGVSGAGKTTYCLGLLRNHLKKNYPALVLSNETITHALSITEAIEQELKRYSPDLLPNSGKDCLELCTNDNPLLILVEDINKANNPTELLKKLIVWANESQHWYMLCPIWNRHQERLDFEKKERLENSKITVKYLNNYTDDEAFRAISARYQQENLQINPIHAKRIVKDLGNDPLLISLVSLTEDNDNKDIIGSYIDQTLKSIIHQNADYFEYELEEAILEFAFNVFKQKNFIPNVRELNQLVSEKNSPIIRLILNDENLYRVHNESITPRHDRIHYYLMAKAIQSSLMDNSFDKSELFFAEIIGLSCVMANLPKNELWEICIKNPLVAFHAFTHAIKLRIDYIPTAVLCIKDWLSEPNNLSKFKSSHRFKSLIILHDVVHPTVKEILALYPTSDHHLIFYETAFKNGDLINGLRLIAHYELGLTVNGLDDLVRFVLYQQNPDIIEEIKAILSSLTTPSKLKHLALQLIGYTEDKEFADSVRKAFEIIPDSEKDYRIFMWAGARVCDDDPESLLAPIFDYWENLSDKEDRFRQSDRKNFARYSLDFSFRDYPPHNSIPYIIDQAQKRNKIKSEIFSLLREVDDPNVFEYQVRDLAKRYQNSPDNAFFVSTMLERTAKKREKTQGYFKPTEWKESFISNESKARLQSLFEDNNNDELIRKYAIKLWEMSISEYDIVVCQRISPTDICYPISIWGRARRRDFTVIDELIEKIKENPIYWWQCARYIWHEKLERLLEEQLTSLTPESNDKFLWIVHELFEKLSVVKAEQLLIDNWHNLSSNPKFIGIALKLATKKLTHLVAQTVESQSESDKSLILEQAKFTLSRDYTSINFLQNFQQLEALKDYLLYFDGFFLENLCQTCLKNDWRDFLVTYLLPRLPQESRIKYTQISTKDLDEAVNKRRNSFEYYWFKENMNLGWKHNELLKALYDWYATQQSEQALQIVDNVLSEDGTRQDFEALVRLLTELNEVTNQDELIESIRFSIFSRSLI